MRVVFFGTPDFAVPSLQAVAAAAEVVLVVCQPDKPVGRGQTLSSPPVKQAALALALPVFQPSTLKDSTALETLRAANADIFVVVAYGKILPQLVLDLPARGCFNLHASLLPQWRGAAPIQRSVMNADVVTGACVMIMEAGLDTGPVVARLEEPILGDDTAGTLSVRLSRNGAALLALTLPAIMAGAIAPIPQEHTAATWAKPLRKEEGVLDFSQSAAAVSAHARGVDPWPGASSFLGAESLKLFSPTVVPSPSGETGTSPGTILALVPGGLVIACGQGAVAFAQLQFPGKKRLPAAAVCSGRRDLIGARLVPLV